MSAEPVAAVVEAATAPPPAPTTLPALPSARARAGNPWPVTHLTGGMLLAAPRGRLPEPDRVDFLAACPACGSDCRWSEERDDTKVKISVDCSCPSQIRS